jgi:broad specificity phosphatase PhoE
VGSDPIGFRAVIVGIRHAHVWNPNGVVYGRLPGFHLSDEGRAAVRALSAALAQAPVRAVSSSPLDRARETAAILAEPHRLTGRKDGRLNEWSFWEHWQGMEWSRMRERDPELLEAYGRDPGSAFPKGSLEMAGRDVLAWAEDAEAEGPGALMLGVTHEAPLIAAMLLGQGRSLSEYHSHNLTHLACVRLLPGPPELVDLAAWAASC